jgi:hypothetical protein
MVWQRSILPIFTFLFLVSAAFLPASSGQESLAVMPVIGLLLTGLIVGAVFVFVKPRIEQALVGAFPQLESNRFINLIFVGVLVLISLSLATMVMRSLKLGGR